MITASHNPPQYNGFKMRKGEKAVFGEEIQEIRKIIEAGNFKVGEGRREVRSVIDDYLSAIKRRIILKRPLKVVADAGNGTTGPIIKRLLEELGYELTELYCELDGAFPHHLPDPTVEKYLADLIDKVKEIGADVGVAFDGDGDRLGAVDENGNIVRGDQLLSLFTREIMKQALERARTDSWSLRSRRTTRTDWNSANAMMSSPGPATTGLRHHGASTMKT